jgi:Tetratricopeptide repeat
MPHCKIAMILRRQGEFDKALEENRSALEIYELSLGAEHPETVKTLTQTLEKKRLNQVSLALMEKLDFGK